MGVKFWHSSTLQLESESEGVLAPGGTKKVQAVNLADWGDKMMSGLKEILEFTKLEGRTWI